VIARENAAQPPEAIVQPATLDLSGGDVSRLTTRRDIIGQFSIAELTDFVPVSLHGPQSIPTNTVDAAIARITSTDRDVAPSRLPYSGKIRGQAPPYDINPATGAFAGTEWVYKVGRSTGYTEGYVSNVAAVVNVEFAGGKATFVNQIAVRSTTDNTGCFAEGGDSGSALITADHQISGLVFAAGPRRTLANPIEAVLRELSSILRVPRLSIAV
jgi:Peptidase family S64